MLDAVGIDRGRGGGVDDVGARFGREFDIGVHRSRVPIEVLTGTELGRVDEDAGDHRAAEGSGEADQ